MNQIYRGLFVLPVLLLLSACESKVNSGLEAYNNGEYEKAYRLFSKSADEGDSVGQFNLAILYENGKGVSQNYKEAVRLYTLSSEQGNTNAQVNLGYMFIQGKGIPENRSIAYEYWKKAADNGHTMSQRNIQKLCISHPEVCQ